MIKNGRTYSILIIIIFCSCILTSILIESGNNILIFGQLQNEENNLKKNNNNYTNTSYSATLSGSQQVPLVQTNGTGIASFELLLPSVLSGRY